MHAAAAATAESRIVISGMLPAIDDGRFPAKRIVGEQVAGEADIFSDSHPVISEEIVWRADDEEQWRRARMHLLPNDRWRVGAATRRAVPFRRPILARSIRKLRAISQPSEKPART